MLGLEGGNDTWYMGGDPAGSLVPWTFPALLQISLSNFLFNCVLGKLQKQPWFHKCRKLPIDPRDCPAGDFLLTETQEDAAWGAAVAERLCHSP